MRNIAQNKTMSHAQPLQIRMAHLTGIAHVSLATAPPDRSFHSALSRSCTMHLLMSLQRNDFHATITRGS